MADTRKAADRDAARNRAQSHFSASEQRDSLVKEMIEKERASVAARTERLRKLRLAKEEADRIAAANAPKPDVSVKSRSARAARVRKKTP